MSTQRVEGVARVSTKDNKIKIESDGPDRASAVVGAYYALEQWLWGYGLPKKPLHVLVAEMTSSVNFSVEKIEHGEDQPTKTEPKAAPQFKIDGVNFEAILEVLEHYFPEFPPGATKMGVDLIRKHPLDFFSQTFAGIDTNLNKGEIYKLITVGIALAVGSNAPELIEGTRACKTNHNTFKTQKDGLH